MTPEAATDRGLRLLVSLTRGGARLNRVVARSQTAFKNLAEGFLTHALSGAEMSSTTVALYGVDAGAYETQRSLSDWERDWYEAVLPPAPARVLVTAAGKGREVAALRSMGYTVDAFEPVESYVERCSKLAGDGLVLTADYLDFCRAVLDDGQGPAAPLAGRVFDAVILGWGSLTHVLTHDEQQRVLAASCALSPQGPVLASFFARGAAAARPESRAGRLGAAAGRLVGRFRGVSAAPLQIAFFWHLGFTYAYSAEDLEGLAATVERQLEWQPEPYGHATFLPPS